MFMGYVKSYLKFLKRRLRIFISYASEHRQIADRVALGLRSEGNDVFFDRDKLPAGDIYDRRIREAINRCDLIVFLISPESVAPGSYALTELGFAREKWNSPAGHVLPVFAKGTVIEEVPPYLRAVSILTPSGDIVAEVLGEVAKFKKTNPTAWILATVAAFVTIVIVANFPVTKENCPLHLAYNSIPPHTGALITRMTVKGITYDTYVSEEGISIINVRVSRGEAWQIELMDSKGVLSAPVTIIGCPTSLEERILDRDARLSISPQS
jgi:hypothetical protein